MKRIELTTSEKEMALIGQLLDAPAYTVRFLVDCKEHIWGTQFTDRLNGDLYELAVELLERDGNVSLESVAQTLYKRGWCQVVPKGYLEKCIELAWEYYTPTPGRLVREIVAAKHE